MPILLNVTTSGRKEERKLSDLDELLGLLPEHFGVGLAGEPNAARLVDPGLNS